MRPFSLRSSWVRRLGLVAVALLLSSSMDPASHESSERVAHAETARPWLGISMDSDEHGVRVKKVMAGSPAETAGLQEGDRIVELEGTPIGMSQQVVRMVAAHAVGDMVALSIHRAEKPQVVRLKLTARPALDDLMRNEFVGKFAPEWSNVALVGVGPVGATKRADLQGKVTLLEFWATWCSACRYVEPVLANMSQKYGALGVQVVAMSTEERDVVAKYLSSHKTVYANVIDTKGETQRAYGVGSTPTLFVIDKRGVVRDVMIGYDPAQVPKIDALVKKLAGETVIKL